MRAYTCILLLLLLIIIIIIRSWRTGRDNPNDSIAENGQNPETSPGDLRRLAAIETAVKYHYISVKIHNLMLM